MIQCLHGLSPSHFFRTQKHVDHGGIFLLSLFLTVGVGSAYEFPEQRVWLQWLRLKFGMKLASNKKWMTWDLNHLYIGAVGSRSRNPQPRSYHGLFIFTVEFVARAVPLTKF